MNKIAFTNDLTVLLRGSRTLLVVATARTWKKRRFPGVLSEKLRGLAIDLARDVGPGDNGNVQSTLTGGTAPRRLAAGVLPDQVSRHNSPARAEAVRAIMSRLGADTRGKTAVLLVLEDAAHLTPAANAVGRALPLFSLRASTKPTTVQIAAVDTGGRAVRWTRAVKETVAANREAARLVDTPPTDLDPAALAREAKALLRGITGVRVREFVGPALLANKLGGIHAVGRCAVSKPRLLQATFSPRGAKKHVALVGKGITYDTGGLNIKTGSRMSGMKGDMGGAAAVLGAFRVLASSGCKHKLSLVLCIAENAIGPAAYKPDDVVVFHSGKTVEINNTDAEGRLLLADGVSWAARKLKADVVIDAATLTGAQGISTGYLHAAVVSNEEELETLLLESGRASGDLCHPLPFAPEFYRREFRSEIADLKNSVANRKNAQSSCAAIFVYEHIADAGVRWGHVDLASPARPRERGTGFGVALLAEAVRRL